MSHLRPLVHFSRTRAPLSTSLPQFSHNITRHFPHTRPHTTRTANFHSTRRARNQPEQPTPAQSEATSAIEQPTPQVPTQHTINPKSILYHDPNRVRTEADNAPGLRPLKQIHPEQMSQNLAFLGQAPLYENAVPKSAQAVEIQKMQQLDNMINRGLPDLANLNNSQIHPGASFKQRAVPGGLVPPQAAGGEQQNVAMKFKDLTEEEKAVKHKSNFKKVLPLSICIGVVYYSIHQFYVSKGVMGDKKTKTPDEDFTVSSISNEQHSVSELAEEIMQDYLLSLKSPEDHARYLDQITELPYVFKAENAVKLPLFLAKNPTKLQVQFNQGAHKAEMAKIYSAPPLNNKTVETYLSGVELANREYRLAHDAEHIKDLKPKTPQQVIAKVGYELNLQGMFGKQQQ